MGNHRRDETPDELLARLRGEPLDVLKSAYPDGRRAEARTVRRDSKVPNWNAGIEYDETGGEFRTRPAPVDTQSEPDPDEAELLEEFSLDASKWEVVSARKSLWQGGQEGGWLQAHRVSFRPRGAGDKRLSADQVEEILSRYPVQEPDFTASTDRLLMIPAGDLQLGKGENGGTAATVERFASIINNIASDLKASGGVKALLLPWVGDCLEGIVSQGGRMLTTLDMPITEQLRVYRRLGMHQLAMLAPYAEQILVPVVPGNHDETTRAQIMPLSDSWAIEGMSAVADWAQGREGYEHIQFIFPEEGEAGVTVNVGTPKQPFVLAFAHGHTTGSNPNKVIDWWKGQTFGRQLTGQADVLVTAHWHHLRVIHTGGNKTWIQIPALDGGSDWFRRKTGDEATTGILSVEIVPGRGDGLKNLTVHT